MELALGIPTLKRTENISYIVNNLAVHCLLVIKFDLLTHYGTAKAIELLKSTFVQNQDGGN